MRRRRRRRDLDSRREERRVNAYVIHAQPGAPDLPFVAYSIRGVTSIERSASMVVLRGEHEIDALAAGKVIRVKASVATLALGPGVSVVLGDRPPRGVRLSEEEPEERSIGFEPPVGDSE